MIFNDVQRRSTRACVHVDSHAHTQAGHARTRARRSAHLFSECRPINPAAFSARRKNENITSVSRK